MKRLRRLILATATLLFLVPVGLGQEQVVRVASYNIKFLSTAVARQGDRQAKLLEVVERLEADVIGLQEIKDRAALNLIFPPSHWEIVMTWMPTISIFFSLGLLTTRFFRIVEICFSLKSVYLI